MSEGVEKYRADMDKDFLKEKLEELKAADTNIVEKAIAAFSAGATISEVRTARAAKADSIEVRKIYAHRWTERFENSALIRRRLKRKPAKCGNIPGQYGTDSAA